MHTSDYLRCLRIKRTVTVNVNLSTTSENATAWPHYLVKRRTCSSDWRYVVVVFLRCLRLRKEPVVMWGNLNVRQAASQQVFKKWHRRVIHRTGVCGLFTGGLLTGRTVQWEDNSPGDYSPGDVNNADKTKVTTAYDSHTLTIKDTFH